MAPIRQNQFSSSCWPLSSIWASVEERQVPCWRSLSASTSVRSATLSGYRNECLRVMKACDQLDEASGATRHGLPASARAQAAPRSKQRAGGGEGGVHA